ncbi:MAG TPA: hypothetical protein VHC22_06900 [Pirellulales bacterium]|nr:hypothetical protein [Pirellulales bacterium]
MPRQFPLKTLLWLMVVVGAFLGGMVAGTKIEAMRKEFEIGPAIHLNSTGQPAKPGEPITGIRHTIRPKWPW